jgi:hypothetical protein
MDEHVVEVEEHGRQRIGEHGGGVRGDVGVVVPRRIGVVVMERDDGVLGVAIEKAQAHRHPEATVRREAGRGEYERLEAIAAVVEYLHVDKEAIWWEERADIGRCVSGLLGQLHSDRLSSGDDEHDYGHVRDGTDDKLDPRDRSRLSDAVSQPVHHRLRQ